MKKLRKKQHHPQKAMKSQSVKRTETRLWSMFQLMTVIHPRKTTLIMMLETKRPKHPLHLPAQRGLRKMSLLPGHPQDQHRVTNQDLIIRRRRALSPTVRFTAMTCSIIFLFTRRKAIWPQRQLTGCYQSYMLVPRSKGGANSEKENGQ